MILFQYSPIFLVLLSMDTAKGFTLILLLFFFLLFLSSFLYLLFIFFFEEHWSKLEMLALLQFSSQYSPAFPVLLSVDTVKDIILLLNLSIGVDWMHIYYSKKAEMIRNLCCESTDLFLHYSSPRSGIKRALDGLKFRNSQHRAIN